MQIKNALIALAAVVLLTSCAVGGSTTAKKPGEATGGFMGLSKNDDVIVDTDAAFKGQSNVINGSFKVGFIKGKKDSHKARGGGKASANVTLLNVDADTMQKVTDAAYGDFISKLKAAGYTIADRGQLLNSEEFSGASDDASPYSQEASMFGGSTTMTYFAPTQLGNKIYWGMGEGAPASGGMFAGFNAAAMGGGASMKAMAFAEKNKVPVLFVNYIVDFANSEGAGYFSANIDVGPGITIPANMGSVAIYGGYAGSFSSTVGSVKLGQPVYSEAEFTTAVTNTTSDANVASQYAANVLMMMAGGSGSQTRSYDFAADANKYSKVATGVLGDANAKLVNSMSKLK